MTYDPRNAANALRAHARPKLVKDGDDMTILTEHGKPVYEMAQKPQTFAMPLRAFADDSPLIPDDFHNVERSGKGLRAHTRPDGAVYLGAFDIPNDTSNTIVIFGDPLMPLDAAKHVSILFRRKLLQLAEDAERERTKLVVDHDTSS